MCARLRVHGAVRGTLVSASEAESSGGDEFVVSACGSGFECGVPASFQCCAQSDARTRSDFAYLLRRLQDLCAILSPQLLDQRRRWSGSGSFQSAT
jgi:hypothetical protein